MPEKITVELLGGLGNQMSGIASAIALPGIHYPDVIFDASRINGKLHDSVAYFGFELVGLPAQDKPLLNRTIHNIGRKIVFVMRPRGGLSLQSRYIQNSRKLLLAGDSQRTLGREDPLPSSLKRVQGFFEDCAHLGTSHPPLDDLFSIGPESTSPWFDSTLRFIRARNPIGVHIRRGDYEKLKIEVMGRDYYAAALDLLEKRGLGNHPLLIFSDDMKAATQLLSGVTWRGKVAQAHPPPGIPAAESLLLLASCKAIIAANSTFSWWGVHLGEEHKLAVGPIKTTMSSFGKCPHVSAAGPLF